MRNNYYSHLACMLLLYYSIFNAMDMARPARIYAWQQDDLALLDALPDKYVPTPATFAHEPEKPLSMPQMSRHKNITKSWQYIGLPPLKLTTKTQKEKRKQVTKFFAEQLALGSQNAFDRDAALQTLIGWDESKIELCMYDTQFDEFITQRVAKKDTKSLYILATLLDKTGRKLRQKEEKVSQKRGYFLETKALDIAHQINQLARANKAIQDSISSHLEYIALYEPALHNYYQSLSGLHTQKQVSTFNLSAGLPDQKIPALNSSDIAPPIVPKTHIDGSEETKSSSQDVVPVGPSPSTNSATSNEPANLQEEIDRLARLYIRQYKTGSQKESVKTAWDVTKKAKRDSTAFSDAKMHIQKVSNKNDFDALSMMASLELDNPEQAIDYFIKAQAMRPDIILEFPEKTDRALTLGLLASTSVKFILDDYDYIAAARHFIFELAINQKNKRAAQALALFHSKNAAINPANQLSCLHGAKLFADLLDPAQDAIDPALNLTRLYYNYYQQLYVFAQDKQNYAVKGVIPLPNLLFATQHLAKATCELVKLCQKNPSYARYDKKAHFAFYHNLHAIQVALEGEIAARIKDARQDRSKISILIDTLLTGIAEIPLSVEQRKTVIQSLKEVDNGPDSLVACLLSNNFVGSPYAKIFQEKNAAHDYAQMLFAIDREEHKEALRYGQKAQNLGSSNASAYIKNLLMRTNLVFKTDEQKLKSVLSNLQILTDDIALGKKTNIFLHCDTITTLKQMCERRFLLAFPALIGYYCAVNQKGSSSLVIELMDKAAASATHHVDLCRMEILSGSIWECLFDYCTMNKETFDPIYKYTQLLLEVVPTGSEEDLVTISQPLAKATADIEKELNTAKKESAFWKKTPMREALIEKLERILADNSIVSSLKTKPVHKAILDLYFLFNPDAGNAMEKLYYPAIDALVESGNKKNPASVPQSVNRPSEERYSIRKKLTEFRKSNHVAEYKRLYEKNPPTPPHLPNQQPMEIIETLMLQMGHEYLLAQAESDKQLNPMNVPGVNSLIHKAISIHPLYAYTTIAYELTNDHIFPPDVETGRGFLLRANQYVDAHKGKIPEKDLFLVGRITDNFEHHIIISGTNQPINSKPNKVRSEKIV